MAVQTIQEYAKQVGGYFNEPNCTDLDHIPGDYGLPIIGRTYDIMNDLKGVLNEHVTEYGRISRVGFAFQKGIMVTHPDDLQRIFLDREKAFSNNMGYKSSIGNFYDGALLTRDFDDHIVQRRLFQNVFKNKALKSYVDLQNPVVQESIANWDKIDNFLFVDEVRKILLDIASKVFIGFEECKGEEAQKLNKAFYDITEKGLMAVFKWNIPGFKYHAGMRGKQYLEDFYRKMIPIRRANPGKDLMSMLVMEKDEEGNYWPDEVLIPHLSLLLFASHDTTTGTLSHVLMYLSKPENQKWQERLREQAVALDKELPDYEDLEKMVDFENAFNEAMRFHPAVTLMPRRTVREIEMGGHRIPANTMAYTFPVWAQTHPDYWTNPMAFDPDRFAPERKEQKSHPFAFLPFGGGAHKCLGMHFAYLNGKIILHQLLRKYKFELADGYDCHCEVIPMPFPSKKLPLKITRL